MLADGVQGRIACLTAGFVVLDCCCLLRQGKIVDNQTPSMRRNAGPSVRGGGDPSFGVSWRSTPLLLGLSSWIAHLYWLGGVCSCQWVPVRGRHRLLESCKSQRDVRRRGLRSASRAVRSGWTSPIKTGCVSSPKLYACSTAHVSRLLYS